MKELLRKRLRKWKKIISENRFRKYITRCETTKIKVVNAYAYVCSSVRLCVDLFLKIITEIIFVAVGKKKKKRKTRNFARERVCAFTDFQRKCDKWFMMIVV